MLGAPQKTEAKHSKMGISLESETAQKLQNYADKKFKGNRSAAANYLLSALQKKSP